MALDSLDEQTLETLYQHLDITDFMRVFAARFHAGRGEEVRAFVRHCDTDILSQWSYKEGDAAPWRRNPALWHALASTIALRGRTLPVDPIPFSRVLSQEMQAIARSLVAQPEQAGSTGQRAAEFVHDELARLFWYPEMGADEALALLDWGLALGRLHGCSLSLTRPDGQDSDILELATSSWKQLYLPLSADALLALAERHRIKSSSLFVRYGELRQHLPERERWLPWHPFFTRYPEAFLAAAKSLPDPGLFELRWQTRPSRAVAGQMLAMLHGGAIDRAYVLETLDRMVRSDPQPFIKQFEHDPDSISPLLAKHLLAEKHEALLLAMILTLTPFNDKHFKPFRDIVRDTLLALPGIVGGLDAAGIVRVLPLIDAAASPQLLCELGKALKTMSAKSIRSALPAWARKQDLKRFIDAGWMEKPNKNMVQILRDMLLTHADAGTAARLLQDMLAQKLFDPASRSVVEAHLTLDAPAPAPALPSDQAPVPGANDLGSAETAAASIKRISVAVKRFDEPAILALLAPLSPHAARVVFHLAATAEADLPPLFRDLWRHVPLPGQAELAAIVAAAWTGGAGEPKLNWCLRLAGPWADERSVDILRDAAQSWGKDKTKRQRASMAVDCLGQIGSAHALARVHQLSSTARIKASVAKAARRTFAAVAALRGLTPGELHDELTLDTSASNASAFQAGLMTPQMPRRMLDAFLCGRSWPVARWRQLFFAHPILREQCKSLIWRIDDAGSMAQPGFRIAEDDTLIDVADRAVQLPAVARIGLWHPVHAQAGEPEAWRAHLADYGLAPLFDQTSAAGAIPAASQLKAGLLVPQGRLSNKAVPVQHTLKACGYQQGWDAGMLSDYWHELLLPFENLTIRIKHSYCVEWIDDDVDIESVSIFAGETSDAPFDPAGLPAPLRATVQGHLDRIGQASPHKDDYEAPQPRAGQGGGMLLIEFGFEGTDSDDFGTVAEALSLAMHEGSCAANAYLAEVLQSQAPDIREATLEVVQHDWFWAFNAETGWQFDHARQIATMELEYKKPLKRAEVKEFERWAKACGALRVVS